MAVYFPWLVEKQFYLCPTPNPFLRAENRRCCVAKNVLDNGDDCDGQLVGAESYWANGSEIREIRTRGTVMLLETGAAFHVLTVAV